MLVGGYWQWRRTTAQAQGFRIESHWISFLERANDDDRDRESSGLLLLRPTIRSYLAIQFQAKILKPWIGNAGFRDDVS